MNKKEFEKEMYRLDKMEEYLEERVEKFEEKIAAILLQKRKLIEQNPDPEWEQTWENGLKNYYEELCGKYLFEEDFLEALYVDMMNGDADD